ncbi:hypothetical protein DFH29DRAFT_982906 [Suillus ampliporus]|nr:hypothetical protein DFH29DRAFT_982906 [Suillus ampliporus]
MCTISRTALPSVLWWDTFVDAVGCRIDAQRKRPPKLHKSLMSDEAIDQCKNAYEAADRKKQKTAMDSFNNTGIMALICRHDIPLFFANINSPGEQQKYLVALIEHLFTLLPPQATVVTLYDVGCVLARSLSKDPEMKTDLGEWIKHCLKRGIKAQSSAALDIINHCETSVADLQAQWADQRQSQLSIQHAPAHLKKELDMVLALQADLDTSDRALQTTKTMLEKEAASDDTLDVLESLQRGHDCLMTKVEALYSSLNVHDKFPELNRVNLDFVHVLLDEDTFTSQHYLQWTSHPKEDN